MAQIKRIKVGVASCGVAAGAEAVLEALKRNAGEIPVVGVGCIGHCYAEPMVEVETDNGSIFYSSVKGDDASAQKILSLSEDGRFVIPEIRSSKEALHVTKLAGRIEPCNLDEYKANGGFSAIINRNLKRKERIFMELQIFKAIVHVLDSSGGAPVFSDRLLELDGDTADYLAAHLEKAYYNDAVKNCSFLPESTFPSLLLDNQDESNFPLDPDVEKQSCETLLPLMETADAPFLSQTEQCWQETIDWMYDEGLISEKPDGSEVMATIEY